MTTRTHSPARLGEAPSFVASREVSLAASGSAAVLSAYLAWSMHNSTSRAYSPLFWIFTGVSAMKFLHDMSAPPESGR